MTNYSDVQNNWLLFFFFSWLRLLKIHCYLIILIELIISLILIKRRERLYCNEAHGVVPLVFLPLCGVQCWLRTLWPRAGGCLSDELPSHRQIFIESCNSDASILFFSGLHGVPLFPPCRCFFFGPHSAPLLHTLRRLFNSSFNFHYLQHVTFISSALIILMDYFCTGRSVCFSFAIWGWGVGRRRSGGGGGGGPLGCKVMPFHLHISASRTFACSSEESNCPPSRPSKFQNSKQFMGRICNQHSPSAR